MAHNNMSLNRIMLFLVCIITLFAYYFVPKFFIKNCYNIVTIDSYSMAQKALKTADQRTLVLFDVDDTLIVTPNKNFWHNKERIRKLEIIAYEKAGKKLWGEWEYFTSIRLAKETPFVIESLIPEMIASLQARKVKVLALTNYSSGTMGIIPSLPKWRSDKLKEVGIDFGKSDFPNTVFDELSQSKNGFYPVLYEGILLTNRLPKGEVLGAFLDRMHYKPVRVLFFDDGQENIESVRAEMCKRKIPFAGYIYRGAMQLTAPFDEKVVMMQLDHLLTHAEWLSDQEAQALLETGQARKQRSKTVYTMP